ncbi:MAG: UDP-N-acetylmuramate dehydrogenase [Clostridiales bacterium]|nr:UDP-N-acetylmuramate dehydrogenase [Clostridiales bacterium]
MKSLPHVLKDYNVLYDEPLLNHTTFKIGGPADALALPESGDELRTLLCVLRNENIRYMIMGNGSNLLFPDSGFRGVIISTTRLTRLVVSDNIVYAEAGVLMSKTAAEAMRASLTGLEFASGIPGTLGGAVFMNAGAYGGEIKDVFFSAEILTSDGSIQEISPPEMNFGYRKSIIQENGSVLLSAVLKLRFGDYEEIKAKTDELTLARRSKQPIEMPSAGSVFRRPPGHYVGKLIMESGLRGYSVGGAQVSEKHCGFIVNKGGASCDDVLRLIDHIQTTVFNNFKVSLIPEIRIVR